MIRCTGCNKDITEGVKFCETCMSNHLFEQKEMMQKMIQECRTLLLILSLMVDGVPFPSGKKLTPVEESVLKAMKKQVSKDQIG